MHWIVATLVSALFLGCYDLCAKHAVQDNAVLRLDRDRVEVVQSGRDFGPTHSHADPEGAVKWRGLDFSGPSRRPAPAASFPACGRWTTRRRAN